MASKGSHRKPPQAGAGHLPAARGQAWSRWLTALTLGIFFYRMELDSHTLPEPL